MGARCHVTAPLSVSFASKVFRMKLQNHKSHKNVGRSFSLKKKVQVHNIKDMFFFSLHSFTENACLGIKGCFEMIFFLGVGEESRRSIFHELQLPG